MEIAKALMPSPLCVRTTQVRLLEPLGLKVEEELDPLQSNAKNEEVHK